MRDLEFIPGSRGSRQSRGNDVAARCSEPPFPTHGGQDDGSYTNSLKIAFNLKEFVLTPIILAIARGKGGSEQRALTPLRRDPQESPGEFQMVQIHYAFTAKVTRVTLRCNVFLFVFHTPLI